ncbi:MAG: hypothetical protein KAT05_11100 [Spirochaetes bacterium]|nr:hypothetical protein [Spirochaetota bacterium]
MSNVTISIDNNLLQESKKYAQQHGTSLNSLIRRLLKKTVEYNSTNWVDECFNLMDKTNGNSNGKKWKRENLYDV